MTQPKRMHTHPIHLPSLYFRYFLFFFSNIFFLSFFFFFLAVVVTVEGASPRKNHFEWARNGEWGGGTIAAGYASRTTEKWVSKPGAHYYITNEIPTPRTQTKVPYLSSLDSLFSSFFFLFRSFRLDMATPHVTVGLLQQSSTWWWRGFRVVPCQMQRFTGAIFVCCLRWQDNREGQRGGRKNGRRRNDGITSK